MVQHLSVAANRSAGHSSQHIAGNSCGGASLKRCFAVIGQQSTTCTQTDISQRIDVTEEGHSTQDIILAQTRQMLQRRTRNRHQRIQRNRINTQLSKADSHIKTVLPGFAHTDNTAGAGAHALLLNHFQRVDFHIIGMRGADVGEVALRGFDVVVIAGDTCLMQTMQLLTGKEPHGSAQINLQITMHSFIRMNRLVELFAGQRLACGYNGKAVHALLLVQTRQLHDILLRQEAVNLAIGMVMCGLRTEFAVFRTAAAAPVDDGAQIHALTDKMLADFICAFT